jgi:hypothetical protein
MDSNDRSASRKLRFDLRVAFAVLALGLASCQGMDSGGGFGGSGDMAPPVQNPGSIGASPGAIGGPTTGPNGQEELTNPGSTLAPNEQQYPVAQGPEGLKCPLVQEVTCTISFNMPPPSASPSPSPSGSPNAKATPTPKPTPTPSPTPAPTGSGGDDAPATPTPSPTPPGTITMQMEPLPKDLPSMTNPDPRLLRVTPAVAIRLQSDTNFTLKGGTEAAYELPAVATAGHVFTLQLYNETYLRGKRVDQFLGSYDKWTGTNGNVTFTFSVPQVTVRRGQIWLLALYGAQLAPGTTPTPSPTPSGSASPSAAPSTSASASSSP